MRRLFLALAFALPLSGCVVYGDNPYRHTTTTYYRSYTPVYVTPAVPVGPPPSVIIYDRPVTRWRSNFYYGPPPPPPRFRPGWGPGPGPGYWRHGPRPYWGPPPRRW
ncbi:hypothetical protein FOB45_19210 [Pseudomonas luteola]|nr:hypothetical protein FOB45_19210 [Pseudomonas luteola]